MRTSALGVVALLAVSACATKTTPPATDAGASQAASPSRNRDVITRDELQVPSITGLTVLDAIKTLRPNFLVNRGMNTMPAHANNDPDAPVLTDQESGKVHASIDGSRVVPVSELENIRAGTVAEIRLLSVAAAMQKFGSNSRQGPVILVKTM
jgi:hypothetical protein